MLHFKKLNDQQVLPAIVDNWREEVTYKVTVNNMCRVNIIEPTQNLK